MALSSAERQRNYVARLKSEAQPISGELMRDALRLCYEDRRQADSRLPDWETYYAQIKAKDGPAPALADLEALLPREGDDLSRFGADAYKVRKARTLINALGDV